MALVVAMCATMGSSGAVTYTVATFGPELTDEFGLSRASLGFIPSVMYLTAVLASRPLGRLVDHVGAVAVSVVMLVVTPLGVGFIALASSYPMLVVGAMVGGLLLAASNPATNAMLASRVDRGSRGAMMGLKQAGATMMSLYVGGVGPPLAAAVGWHEAALIMVAVMPFTALSFRGVRAGTMPPSEGPVAVRSVTGGAGWIRWLSVYSVLLGVATANSNTYFVLYAKQSLGFSPLHAGWLVALMGAAGIAGRIGWAWLSERQGFAFRALCWIAAIAAVATALMILAPSLGWAAMWIAVAVSGFTVQGWNSVGMLTVVHLSAIDSVGATSGTVVLPFFLGLAAGPTMFGAVVDLTGHYAIAWGMQLAVLLLALVAALALYRTIDRSLTGVQ